MQPGGAMTDIRWKFRKMVRAEMNQDPMQREFFDEEPINTRLVRESIQNSLDAGIAHVSSGVEDQPVRVRFSLAGIHHPLPPHRAERYFIDLAPHLDAIPELDDAIRALAAHNDLTRDPVPFIVVEDAGTIGLEGNYKQNKDSESRRADNNHFYWFFRNVGRSGKGDTDNGSWGLGKWVFPDASLASAYIAVTRRQSDDDTLLMGQSVLKQHDIDGRQYVPYGYFAAFEDDGFQLPLRASNPEHAPYIDQCIEDFGLQYQSQPGLSIVIPFPRIFDEEAYIETPKMLAAIVDNYFYPIIAGRLEVTLDEGDGSPPIEITADTIDDVLDRADLKKAGERSPGAYRHLFKMTRQCLEVSKGDYIEISASDLLEIGDDGSGLIELRRRYNAYELLAFRISTDVQRKKGAHENTKFRLYVQRDDSLTEGHDYYVRGTLSISEMDFLEGIRARTLLVVDENEPLAAMLRDSEPPAHTSWRPQTSRVAEHWVAPQRRITAIRQAPIKLLRALEAPREGVQKDAFADVFFLEREKGKAAAAVKDNRGKGGIKPPPSPPQRPSDFAISESSDGFRVTADNSAETTPQRARLQVAYDVLRGDPLKLYNRNDFRLRGVGKLPVTIEGGSKEPAPQGSQPKDNELYVRIEDPQNFSISVQGFDPNRDVFVRVEKLEEEAKEDDDS